MKKRNFIGLTTVTMAAAFATGPVAAQEDPTALGGGKKPYVLVIIDSSASMEYTEDGDNRYPIVDTEDNGANLPLGDGTADATTYPLYGEREWYPGIPMEIDANSPGDGPTSFGSCFVWEQTMSDQDCDSYQRPSWRPPPGALFEIATSPTSWHGFGITDTEMWLRFQEMRGGWRLQPETQPRHVTIKEVLTGDMIMLPESATTFSATSYNSRTDGPGCWFVPRQRDASVQPKSDQTYCEGVDPADQTPFEVLPDFDTPLPHFQEVYDLQKNNGVLDRLATSAIFAVAAFDGYRDDVDWDPNKLNDEIGGTHPDGTRMMAPRNEDSDDCNGDGAADDPCYNLGLWRIVTPKDLEIPTTYLPELAAFTQIAINDTGYLNENDDDEFVLDPDKKKSEDNSFLGASFSKDFKKYIDKVDLGKQPIARATPLAGAMYDTRQFLAQVQDDDHVLGKDRFKECRPKHVVVMTDGKPEPEWDDPTTLNEAFGYDASRYVYDETEVEINSMLADPALLVSTWDADERAKYAPRVHVVGLNLGTDTDGDGVADNIDDDAVRKMTRMAIEGNSCAELLVPHLIPPSGTKPDGDGGDCTPGTGCLVDQSQHVSDYASNYTFTNPATGETADCNQYPALILDNNEASVLSSALFSMFSALIDASGMASRTRLVVTNRLDDVSIPSGGQYRVYSGVKIGGSAWWKGILNRTTIKCDPTDPEPELSFDGEVARQVSLSTSAVEDNRRIWTTVPHTLQWCFDCKTPEPTSDYATQSPRDSTYVFTYDLYSATADEFQGTYVDAQNPAGLLGTRVPFEYSQLRHTYDQGSSDPVFEQFNAGSEDELRHVINVFRARIEERAASAQGGTAPEGRAIGGILNSNPVIVGPPNLDLPIGSYRNFRARYADRATMLYVSSMDGLLHAIHTGRLEERVNVRAMTPEDTVPADDVTGSAEEQREAWAYMPFMLHRELADNQVSQAYLMDGSPQVKDVRLCNSDPDKNQNRQACTFICSPNSPNCDTFPSDLQWRTVLVQGRGLAGAGYYAMDVTRPGGLQAEDSGAFAVQNPDPITLWEFDREWERVQVQYLYDRVDRKRVASPGLHIDDDFYDKSECNDDEHNFWKSPLMGLSVSEPEIATIIVEGPNGRAQRPVAVFGGGANIPDVTECGGDALGMAIYVVDLQTGSLLRRFTSYIDSNGNEHFFGEPHRPAEDDDDPGAGRFVGSPALFDSSSGAIATRGFIGDTTGRMFKMNFVSDDPLDWEVSLFFDPNDTTENPELNTLYESQGLDAEDDAWGPASFKPAIALNPNRDVMVVYGLGEVGDTVSNNQGQAILALTEDRADPSTGILSWAEVFPEGEKLTGAPTIFNRSAYFSTYALPDADVCEPGTARVWGLRLPDQDPNSLVTVGSFDGNATLGTNPAGIVQDSEGKWFGPDEPTLIRGVTITLGEMCTIDNAGTDDPTFSSTDRPRPQLVAQTSGTVDNDLRNVDQTGSPADNVLDRVVLDIDPPQSQSIPLSWSIISN